MMYRIVTSRSATITDTWHVNIPDEVLAQCGDDNEDVDVPLWDFIEDGIGMGDWEPVSNEISDDGEGFTIEYLEPLEVQDG